MRHSADRSGSNRSLLDEEGNEGLPCRTQSRHEVNVNAGCSNIFPTQEVRSRG